MHVSPCVESIQRRRNALLTTLGILALVAVVAIASRGSTPSGGAGARRPTDTLLDIVLSLFIVSLVAGAVLFLYLLALRRTMLAQPGGNRRRDWRNTVGMLVLVGAALLLARNFSSRRLEEKLRASRSCLLYTSPSPRDS